MKGRTPDEDLLQLGRTTRGRADPKGQWELNGFVPKLLPPATVPVADRTTGSTVADALQDKGTHRTKRIKSMTGRD